MPRNIAAQREYIIRCRIEREDCAVFVSAASEEEARQKFERMEWASVDEQGSGIVNYKLTGIEVNE